MSIETFSLSSMSFGDCFHMGFPAMYIDVSSTWSVGNISLTIRYNILLCRFEYSLEEMITVMYSYPYSFDSVDHIRVVGWVLDFSLRQHTIDNIHANGSKSCHKGTFFISFIRVEKMEKEAQYWW